MPFHRRHRPDPSTADRLLAGRVGADDAPPGYRRVAALLDEAGSGFPEPAGSAAAKTVGAMVTAISGAPAPEIASRRSPMLKKVLAAKTIAVVSVLALTASGAAAATGNLPDSVQDQVAKAAKHVGLNLPHGTERVTGAPCVPATPATDGQPATYAKNRGQYLKQQRDVSAEAFEEAKKTRCGMPVNSDGTPGADEADEAPEAPEAPKDKKPKDHGQPNGGQGNADEAPGAPADNPAGVDTPAGSIDTGSTASDGANSTGAENAGDGSGNAEDHPTPEDHPPADLPTPDGLPGAGS